MKTEKAKKLNLRLENAMEMFWTIYREAKQKSLEDVDIATMLTELENANFDFYFQDFISEMIENIEEYKDIELIDNYVETSFSVIKRVDDFDDSLNKKIIKNDFQVKALLGLRKMFEFNLERISNFYYPDEDGNYSIDLKRIFTETMQKTNPSFKLIFTEEEGIMSSQEIHYEVRFDFKNLKQECDALDSYTKKRNLINERMIDFHQWQLLSDDVGVPNSYKSYEYTNMFYPNFIRLCESELQRYDLYTENEEKSEGSLISDDRSEYIWTASDTDLMELIVALIETKSLQREDGKKLTRVELVEYFQELFGIEMKHAESKLSHTGDRIKEISVFLQKLKLAFENYVQKKEEKLKARR